MSSAAARLHDPTFAPSSTAWVDEPVGLAAVFDPAVDVAVLRRPAAFALAPGAAPLDRGRSVQAAVRPAAPDLARLLALFDGATAPRAEAELRALISLFADLTECDEVGVRLATLTAAMCPRFHVDRVTLRAVVTFAGPGTEWVDRASVDRGRLGHAAGGAPDERSGLLRPGARIERADPFDFVALKGTAWPGHAAPGAVHRSPAMDGGARLVLTLDALA